MKIAKYFIVLIFFSFVSCESLNSVFESLSSSLSEISSSSTSNSKNSNTGTPIKTVNQRNQRNQGNQAAYSSTAKINTNSRGNPDATNWDIAALDTAADVDYLTGAEKDVILEMNKARADPKKYAELYIKPMLQYNWGGPFGANSYLIPGETVYTSTKEGKNGIQSCINDISKRKGTAVLLPAKGLYLAAKDHADDTGPKGITGHTGSDKSTMSQRINRYGKWNGGSGENISYGHNAGRDIVVQLLIDDGVSNRGHRNNILNKNFKYTGVSIGKHSQFTYLCVVDYANGYTDKEGI